MPRFPWSFTMREPALTDALAFVVSCDLPTPSGSRTVSSPTAFGPASPPAVVSPGDHPPSSSPSNPLGCASSTHCDSYSSSLSPSPSSSRQRQGPSNSVGRPYSSMVTPHGAQKWVGSLEESHPTSAAEGSHSLEIAPRALLP